MKRRGVRIVSSSSSVVSAPVAAAATARTAPPPAPTPTSAASSPLNVAEATQPALTVPTLNIFARFQSHRGDFDADWLLLKEDPISGQARPPLATHVTDKLRRHQAQLGAHRAAAAADRLGKQKNKEKTNSGSGGVEEGEDADLGAVEAPAPSLTRRQRRPDMYDSAEDEDDEYVPEDRKAAQYRQKKAKSPTPTIASAVETALEVEEVQQESVEQTPSVTVAAPDPKEERKEGLTGDYLNFQSKASAAAKALAEGTLQATVHMRATSPVSLSSSDGRNLPQQQQRRQHGGPNSASAEDRVLIVPLWSTARMEQHGGYCSTSPLIALHQEITDLVDFLRPTQAEVTMRRYIEREIGKLVDGLWPGSHVLVYGSMYTHLLLPQSDLDMTLLDVLVSPEEALTALAKEISNKGLCESAYPQLILKTKIPLIKFAHKGSLINVDISVGAVDGKRNSDCVIRYLNTYPEALPLVIAVKYFLLQRGMHEPYHGGLGSYAATLLVVAFLRQHPIYTTHPEQRPMTGLGKLFVDFLRMCGQFWSYGRVAISLGDLQLNANSFGATANNNNASDSGDFHIRRDLDWGSRMQSPVSPSSPRATMGPAQGSIADPVDSANNAASSLRLFHSVSSMFTYAYLALTADFNTNNTNNKETNVLGSNPARAQVSSPSIDDISRRPTLLSRIFHVDADLVFRRQAIATTYEHLSSEMPDYMEEVRRFHRQEDAAMLSSRAMSWRERRQLRRSGDVPFLWEKPSARSVTTLEERLALAHLHETATVVPSTNTTEKESSNARKRPRQDSGGYDDDQTGDESRKEEKRPADSSAKGARAVVPISSSSASTSSFSSRSSDEYDSDTESNASSVRLDVSRETERSRRIRRHYQKTDKQYKQF